MTCIYARNKYNKLKTQKKMAKKKKSNQVVEIDRTDEIYDMCIDKYDDDAVECLKKEFKNVRYCSEGIDDGLDDGDYLIKCSYDVDNYHVILYYPQSTGLVSHVYVRNDE